MSPWESYEDNETRQGQLLRHFVCSLTNKICLDIWVQNSPLGSHGGQTVVAYTFDPSTWEEEGESDMTEKRGI